MRDASISDIGSGKRERLVAGKLRLDLVWRGDRIAGVDLAWARKGDLPEISTPTGSELALGLERYLAGEDPGWPELPLDWEGVPDFTRRVLTELRAVGPGRTVSYGQLAARSGRPGAARAVGRAMARNPFPFFVPCHRVIGADGSMTGFGPGIEMKTYLLDLEKGR